MHHDVFAKIFAGGSPTPLQSRGKFVDRALLIMRAIHFCNRKVHNSFAVKLADWVSGHYAAYEEEQEERKWPAGRIKGMRRHNGHYTLCVHAQ